MEKAATGTPTERRLAALARRSFLRLWSYPSPYRDQGQATRGGEGAELCDLLVVFDHDIIIFSDKDCCFPEHADIDLAWQRWYRRAVLKSAQQVFGAERWLRSHPDRVYLDHSFSSDCPSLYPIRQELSSIASWLRMILQV